MDFQQAVDKTLQLEGGFVNDPADAGGATNFGITQATLASWRGAGVSQEDVKRLTKAEACQIYKANYWDSNQCDKLPDSVRGVFFDAAVNGGGGGATKLLQCAINGCGGHCIVDGGMGPNTIAEANAVTGDLGQEFSNQREAFYRHIAANNPSQGRFLQGWLNRVQAWR